MLNGYSADSLKSVGMGLVRTVEDAGAFLEAEKQLLRVCREIGVSAVNRRSQHAISLLDKKDCRRMTSRHRELGSQEASTIRERFYRALPKKYWRATEITIEAWSLYGNGGRLAIAASLDSESREELINQRLEMVDLLHEVGGTEFDKDCYHGDGVYYFSPHLSLAYVAKNTRGHVQRALAEVVAPRVIAEGTQVRLNSLKVITRE